MIKGNGHTTHIGINHHVCGQTMPNQELYILIPILCIKSLRQTQNGQSSQIG